MNVYMILDEYGEPVSIHGSLAGAEHMLRGRERYWRIDKWQVRELDDLSRSAAALRNDLTSWSDGDATYSQVIDSAGNLLNAIESAGIEFEHIL